jgi:CRP/FNR family cyclic AMP-dependent transcriptional regulator
MQIEQAKVQAHLQRSNTSALAGIYTEQLTRARDQKEAIGLMACRIATRSHRPLHEGTRNHSRAARRFQTLRARTMAIAAFGGFKQHTKRSERQVLVRAVRRLEGYARRSNLTLEELFDLLDKDGEGTIDVQEFRNGMTSVIGLCLDNETHQALMSYMDTDGSGELDAEEFCGKVTAVLHEESVTSSAVVARLYQHLTKSSSTIDAFLGEQATGMEQFREALDKIGIGLSEDEFAVVMKELDQDGDGQMHVKELSHSFSELERMRRVSALTVLGQVVDFVSRTKSSLNRIFASVDVDGSGTLDMFELQEALRKMQQDLSDFEVSNLMQELDLIGSAEDGSGLAAISCAQFLDKLKMYKSEREVDTVKCKSLFKRLDKDQSGCLDYQEVSQLAKEMGFGDKIDSDSGFVDTLMREIKAAHVGDEGLTLLRASARLDELLAWFLSTGRSYLPRHRYPAQPDLCNLDAQQLKELFAKLDVSGDGLITMDEACQAVSAIWPMLDETAIQIAFEAADHTHSGTISQAGLLLLLRCIIWLNEKRHQVDEVLTRFRSEGVGEGEFRLGCRVLGVLQASSDYSPREFDAIAREHFVAHTAALARDDKLVEFASQGYMSAAQFMVWAVQHATVPSEEKRTREEWATAELEASSGQYGDLFFEDLADILHRSTSLIRVGSKTYEQHTLSQALGKTNSVAVAKRAARGALERLHLLTKGVKDALTRLDSFPGFGDDVMRRLADQCTDDAFFSGQFIMTAGELGDDFVVLRRGMAEVVVDGTVVAEIREGQGVGEMSLLFGTRRNATVKCVGPCEVIVLTRASYQSEISRLPVDQRVGKLESILLKFWDLVAADTGMFNTTGTKQQTVPFSTYRKLHIRITKTLTMPEDEPDYDEEESREISTQDWAEDVKRCKCNLLRYHLVCLSTSSYQIYGERLVPCFWFDKLRLA